MNMTLEIELGVTGGEEDGVDNSGVDHSKLYTQPDDVLKAYDALNPVGNFTVAAVVRQHARRLRARQREAEAADPARLAEVHQRAAQDRRPSRSTSCSTAARARRQEEIREAVSYGVVKMNIDTDTQWAFTQPIKKFMDEKSAYLQAQLGNPEGPDKPNKKYIDPRGWMHLGEKGMTARLVAGVQGPRLVRQVRVLSATAAGPVGSRCLDRAWRVGGYCAA